MPLSGPELKVLVVGATVEIDAPMGYKVPITYAADGTMTGQAKGLAWYLGAESDKGRWWVSGDQLCHKWTVWFSSQAKCLRLSRDGRTVHWQSKDGDTGTAVLTHAAPPPPAQTAAAAPPKPTAPQPTQHAAPPPPRRMEMAANVAPVPPPPAAVDPAPQLAAPLPEAVPERVPVERSVERKPVVAPSPAPEPRRTAERPAAEPPRLAVPTPVPVRRPPTASAAAFTRVGPQEFFVVNVRGDDVLNVRNGPSPDAEIVGELAPGSRGIELMGDCQAEWCPVQHSSARGWVHRYFITSDPTGAMTSASPLQGAREADFARRRIYNQ